MVFAQPVREERREIDSLQRHDQHPVLNHHVRTTQFNPNPVTVSGTLKLQRGMIAVESGENVYFVPLLNRYVGFINGMTEGTRVSVEGLQFRNIIQPIKFTIDGRTYDFPVHRMNQGQMQQQNQRHRIENHGKNHGHGRNSRHQHTQNHRGNQNNRNNQNRSCSCCR